MVSLYGLHPSKEKSKAEEKYFILSWTFIPPLRICSLGYSNSSWGKERNNYIATAVSLWGSFMHLLHPAGAGDEARAACAGAAEVEQDQSHAGKEDQWWGAGPGWIHKKPALMVQAVWAQLWIQHRKEQYSYPAAIGGATGWCTGFTCQKVGKLATTAFFCFR